MEARGWGSEPGEGSDKHPETPFQTRWKGKADTQGCALSSTGMLTLRIHAPDLEFSMWSLMGQCSLRMSRTKLQSQRVWRGP